jgi:gliding motility-associated-like protein
MVKHKIFLLFIFAGCFLQGDLYGQLFVNNGGTVFIASGAIVSINGSAENKTNSTFSNNGNCYVLSDITNNAVLSDNGLIDLKGNWYNNATFNASSGMVRLSGANQILGGSAISSFYNLDLSGTGIKSQTINQITTGTLSLNDRELATDGFIMNINNPSVGAITRTSGLVSSTGNGKLSRQTNSNSTYLFPVGSSLGSLRYRPVEITPNNANANTYQVRMANADATAEGYSRLQLEAGLCTLNPLFYHRIAQTSGASPADVRIYFDPAADGGWQLLANWNTNPTQRWVNVAPVTPMSGSPLSSLTKSAWSGFANEPIILANPNVQPEINSISPLCANGGSVNLSATVGGGTWSGSGITNPATGTFNPATAGVGTHLITYTISGNCSAMDTLSVVVQAGADATITSSISTYCLNSTAVILTAAQSGGVWSGTGITNSSTGQFTPATAGIGTHQIIYSTSGLCGSSDTINIEVISSPNATITNQNPMCSNQGTVVLQAAQNGGAWSGTGITNPATGEFNPSAAGSGNHIITYTFAAGCDAQDTAVIVVNPSPEIAITANSESCFLANDGSGIATSTNGTLPYNYSWSNGAANVNNITALAPGDYSVTVTDAKGCSDDIDFIITRAIDDCNDDTHSIFVPNIFYPGSDIEENKVIKVYGKGIKSLQFTIYDRWGSKVFQTTNQEESWDGSVSGTEENSAVFVYYLDLVFITGKTYTQKGNITLIR